MVEMMNIAGYDAFFHDGSLINIQHVDNKIELSIESSGIFEDDLKDEIVLSKNNTLKGKLHLEGVKNILLNKNQPFLGVLHMLYDSAEIMHLTIMKDRIKLSLEWENFPPHPKVTAYLFLEIEADKIWWENIPDLYNPFW
jgi:hypothetical protein